MSYKVKTFPVKPARLEDTVVFAARVALVDGMRSDIMLAFSRAEDSGIDKQTVLQRFGLSFAKAQRVSKMLRAVPSAIIKIAMHFSFYHETVGYVPAPAGTVGSFGVSSLNVFAGGLSLIDMGGMKFTGVAPEWNETPTNVNEVRITRLVNGTYEANVLYDGSNSSPGNVGPAVNPADDED